MEQVLLVVGLGNPGPDYESTRHNAGFLAAERLAGRARADWKFESRFHSKVARFQQADRRVIVCQPQTFMNVSGVAVGSLVDFYRLQVVNVLIIADDADLQLGTLRLRPGGSSGGHHGLESVEKRLSTRDFARQKIGIGRKPESGRNIAGYVLGKISKTEWPLLDRVLDRACDQVECWMQHGVAKAMNQFNGTLTDAPDETKT